MGNLDAYTDKELLAEIERRKQAAKERWKAERRERATEIYELLPHLLAIEKNHGRTSCSDENPCNEGRCNRCTLLAAQRGCYWDSDLEIRLELERVCFRYEG